MKKEKHKNIFFWWRVTTVWCSIYFFPTSDKALVCFLLKSCSRHPSLKLERLALANWFGVPVCCVQQKCNYIQRNKVYSIWILTSPWKLKGSVYLSACPPICLSIHLSICLSISLSIGFSASFCPSIPNVFLSISLFICLFCHVVF